MRCSRTFYQVLMNCHADCRHAADSLMYRGNNGIAEKERTNCSLNPAREWSETSGPTLLLLPVISRPQMIYKKGGKKTQRFEVNATWRMRACVHARGFILKKILSRWSCLYFISFEFLEVPHYTDVTVSAVSNKYTHRWHRSVLPLFFILRPSRVCVQLHWGRLPRLQTKRVKSASCSAGSWNTCCKQRAKWALFWFLRNWLCDIVEMTFLQEAANRG